MVFLSNLVLFYTSGLCHILLFSVIVLKLLYFVDVIRYIYLQVRFRYGHCCPWMVKRLCLVLTNLGSGWSDTPHLLAFINFFVASSISPVTGIPPNFWKLKRYTIHANLTYLIIKLKFYFKYRKKYHKLKIPFIS